ncbi:MAG: tyrosine-type recombinase/integrase [Acidimicrobiia bacterium]
MDAERYLTTIESDKLRGTYTDPSLGKVRLAEWAERWLSTTVHLKPKTRAGYESLVRHHVLPRFGNHPLGDIDTLAVAEWVAGLSKKGLSASRIRQARQVLGAMLKAAAASRYIAHNPTEGVKVPRERPREMVFLTAEQVEELADAMEDPYDTLVYVLAYGGLRWGEAVALRRRRCDLLRNRLEVAESLAEVAGTLYFDETKSYQRRMVVIPPFLRDRMAAHLAEWVHGDPEALVFTAPEGGPLRHSNFRGRQWLPAVCSAGLPPVTPHQLRHTCAALLIDQGADPKAIQTHLGHSSIQVTYDHYGHLFPAHLQRLAEGLEATYQRAHVDALWTRGNADVIELPDRKPESQAP